MMHRYKDYLEKIAGNTAKEAELKEIVCEALEKFKRYCPEEFYAIMYKIHCVAYGPHFDECLAKKAVAAMHNVDGSDGEHWSYEQAVTIASQHKIKHVADLYYIINMLYSDYAEVLGSDASTYIKLAKAYTSDPDAPEGKAFDLWVAKMRKV